MKRMTCWLVLVTATASLGAWADEPAREGVVRVAALVYADGRGSICFSDAFLTDVARQTSVRIQRSLERVRLDSEELFDYPFVIMSGEQAFECSEAEVRRLAAYLERGGFVLASAGCSNAAWAQSFRQLLAAAVPAGEGSLQPLAVDHPALHTLYDIDRIVGKKPFDGPGLYGLELGPADARRLGVVFSPLGLNDTARAGGGCCCCGGNELRNAAQINANLLIYALTR